MRYAIAVPLTLPRRVDAGAGAGLCVAPTWSCGSANCAVSVKVKRLYRRRSWCPACDSLISTWSK